MHDPIDEDDRGIVELHSLARRWFCVDPSGWTDAVKDVDKERVKEGLRPLRRGEKEENRKRARKGNESGQQDVNEFMRRVLAGLEGRIDER